MAITHEYQTDVNWVHTRLGIISSPEVEGTFNVVTPPQFPQGIDKVWSPEHLFTAAVNGCLMTTFLAIAENFKLEFEQFSSQARGKLEMVDGKYLMSEVTLEPVLTISREDDREKAAKVLQKAEAACLISNSIKSKINFKPLINVGVLSE